MSTGERTTGDTQRECRRVIGKFTLTGAENQVRLTMSQQLQSMGFPATLSDSVDVEHVECRNRPEYIEVHPDGKTERQNRPSERRRFLGEVSLAGTESDVRLELPRHLWSLDFPATLGDGVRVEHVDPGEMHNYLEVHPL